MGFQALSGHNGTCSMIGRKRLAPPMGGGARRGDDRELTLAVTSKPTLEALAETVLSTWSVAAGWRMVSAPSAGRLRCEV